MYSMMYSLYMTNIDVILLIDSTMIVQWCKTSSALFMFNELVQHHFCLFRYKWSHFFTQLFWQEFLPTEQKVVDADSSFRKLQVNLVAELSERNRVTQLTSCFQRAKSCFKNEMIPLGTELKSRFSRSKLLWYNYNIQLYLPQIH